MSLFEWLTRFPRTREENAIGWALAALAVPLLYGGILLVWWLLG